VREGERVCVCFFEGERAAYNWQGGGGGRGGASCSREVAKTYEHILKSQL